MKKTHSLDRWLTWLANIGVIAGIVFLAIEIRQNTDMVVAQTRDNIADKQLSLFEWFAASPENIRVRFHQERTLGVSWTSYPMCLIHLGRGRFHGHFERFDDQCSLFSREAALDDQAAVVIVVVA